MLSKKKIAKKEAGPKQASTPRKTAAWKEAAKKKAPKNKAAKKKAYKHKTTPKMEKERFRCSLKQLSTHLQTPAITMETSFGLSMFIRLMRVRAPK